MLRLQGIEGNLVELCGSIQCTGLRLVSTYARVNHSVGTLEFLEPVLGGATTSRCRLD